MNDLQFNDQADEFGTPPQVSQGTDFTGKFITWGLASTRQQAEYLMIGLAIVIVILSYFVYRWGSTPGAVEITADPSALVQ